MPVNSLCVSSTLSFIITGIGDVCTEHQSVPLRLELLIESPDQLDGQGVEKENVMTDSNWIKKASITKRKMLQKEYGEDCFSRSQCYDWYRHFESGRVSTKDDPKTGRSSTSMGDLPNAYETYEYLGISKSSFNIILSAQILHCSKTCALSLG
ncbi:hypothetical protein AVEN_42683-1 [Araneus ventricosus]|uniref:Mos1 transposase HTH domain-containing protein n=1 Tax=Araneus ventricosus TaxID=182803 RepID=A0A4Y2BP80_ARAVE|nr:hypothetical protein AVEN_42683-1 [Araneus ventricosus]